MAEKKSIKNKANKDFNIDEVKVLSEEKIRNSMSAISLFILEKNTPNNEATSEKRIKNIQKIYLSLPPEKKSDIAKFTSEIIKKKYFQNENFYNNIYSYCIVSGNEDNWQIKNTFFEFLFLEMEDFTFFKSVINCFLRIIDQKHNSNNSNQMMLSNCLAFLAELGIQTSKSKFELNLSTEDSNHIVDFISSNLLSRSNINNKSIHITLVYYLTHTEDKYKIYLNKVLSRFGQSLLEHVFIKYFKDKNENQVAFHFLVQHLDEFLSNSALTAEMSYDVLRNQMLKNPDNFPIFIKKYFDIIKNEIPHNSKKLNSLTIHTTFLLKTACEIGEAKLSHLLAKLVIEYFDTYKIVGKDAFLQQYKFAVETLSKSKSELAIKILHSILDDYYEKSKQENPIKSRKGQIICFNTEKQKKDTQEKNNANSDEQINEINLLNHLYILAS